MEMEGGLRPVARRMRLPTVAVMVDVCVALDLTDAARETLKLESALRVPDDGSRACPRELTPAILMADPSEGN
jgi:hypothetical protein